eukprot:scaffold11426_cov78-Skeletonema_dohrnii-CCMP3373.AAC.1
MHLQSAVAFLALLASACPHVTLAKQQGLRRKLANDCTIMAIERLPLEEGEDPEMIVECELNPDDADDVSGISLLLDASPAQLGALKQLINEGEVTPGNDKLNIVGAEIDDSAVHVPPGLDIASSVRQNVEKEGRRRLVNTIGNLNMLLVKVTDVGGLVYPDSATTMSDKVFGTGTDPVNLKSRLEECSWNQITVKPKALTVDGVPDDTHEVATGVIEVTIDISLTNQSPVKVRHAITTKVQQLLGYSLPGPYDYVLYSVQGCYVDCGWAAYSYINSWNSVYQGVNYRRPGVLIHQLGRNFGLGLSGGLDGATNSDHTCSMGNPHYNPTGDDAFQCFNPAKNFQLNWYNDAKITEDPRTIGYDKTLTMVGIDEYPLRDYDFPVTVRLETGGGADYFVGFNRASATGPNRMNVEGSNQVTIVQVEGNSGESYSQSFLKAKLSQGQSYAITNYDGTGKTVTITALSIDITTFPGTAVINISDGLVPAPPSPPPTPARITPACEGSDPDTCGCDAVKQNDYRGDISTTEDGYTCMNWESHSPHSHTRTANYPDKGIGNHNYCRNPDGEPRAWCYTTDPNKRWSFCDVPSCTPPSTPSHVPSNQPSDLPSNVPSESSSGSVQVQPSSERSLNASFSTNQTCPGAQEMMEVQIRTDSFPGETNWTLTDKCGDNGVILKGGPYDLGLGLFSSHVCANDGQYEFQINDSWGDGICCKEGQGSYLVTFGNVEKASGGEFDYVEKTTFGTCETSQPSSEPSLNDAPSNQPSDLPSNLPSNVPSDLPSNVPSNQPSDLPSNVPSDLPSNVPSNQPSDLPSN